MEKNYFTINGKQFQIDTKKENFLDELIKNYLKHKNIKVAVAVNYELIQKSKWKSKKILKGDEIEIVQPFLEVDLENDNLIIDNKSFKSRLIMGSSMFPNIDVMNKSIEKSESEIVTISIRRLSVNKKDYFFDQIKKEYTFLPNTAGCFTKKEAILTAELARESLDTNWIKLELISEDEMLLPDPIELYSTREDLIKKKFKIFCYCSDDPILCKRLEDLGCEVVMPLISPIGSGLGIRNEHNLELIRSMCKGLVFVDAGIGSPSDARELWN